MQTVQYSRKDAAEQQHNQANPLPGIDLPFHVVRAEDAATRATSDVVSHAMLLSSRL